MAKSLTPTCICPPANEGDGPEEFCAIHGRPYAEVVDLLTSSRAVIGAAQRALRNWSHSTSSRASLRDHVLDILTLGEHRSAPLITLPPQEPWTDQEKGPNPSPACEGCGAVEGAEHYVDHSVSAPLAHPRLAVSYTGSYIGYYDISRGWKIRGDRLVIGRPGFGGLTIPTAGNVDVVRVLHAGQTS